MILGDFGKARKLLLAAGGVLLSGLLLHLIFRPRIEGDTTALVYGAYNGLACLKQGTYPGCESMGLFPLFYMAPAMVLGALGLGERAVLHLFAYFSLICFFASLAILYRILARRDELIAKLGLVIYLSGFHLCYSHSTFTELPASTMGLALVASCLEGSSRKRNALLLFVASLAKEVAAPFLLLLAALSFLARATAKRSGVDWRREMLPLVGSAAGSIFLAIAFNYFRFKSPFNQQYFSPFFIVQDWHHQLSFFLGIWFSPSVGALLGWPALIGLMPLILVKLLKDGAPMRRGATGVGVALIWGVVTLGFSKWYAPFGWMAWGPRLLLPWLPPCLLILLYDYAPEIGSTLSRIGRSSVASGLSAVMVGILTFPNFRVVVFRPYIGWVIDAPGCEGVAVQSSTAQYYECMEKMIWPNTFRYLRTFIPAPRPDLFILATLYSVVLGIALYWILRKMAESPKVLRWINP